VGTNDWNIYGDEYFSKNKSLWGDHRLVEWMGTKLTNPLTEETSKAKQPRTQQGQAGGFWNNNIAGAFRNEEGVAGTHIVNEFADVSRCVKTL
jgi:hypothetical protein